MHAGALLLHASGGQFFRIKAYDAGGIAPGNLPYGTDEGIPIPDLHYGIPDLAGNVRIVHISPEMQQGGLAGGRYIPVDLSLYFSMSFFGQELFKNLFRNTLAEDHCQLFFFVPQDLIR